MKEFNDFFFNNWILIVILGNFLTTASSIFSKIAVSDSVSKPVNPTAYTFYSGLGGAVVFVVALILNIRLNFLILNYETGIVGIITGIFLILGLCPFYVALRHNEILRILTLS